MDKTKATKKQGLTPLFVKGPAQLDASDQAWVTDEFPERKSLGEVGRRDLLKMMGGALALAGVNLTGCRYMPQRKIVPFVDQPEGAEAGLRKTYASCASFGGYAVGVLVSQVDGRPVRIDGNPLHPASQGRLNSMVMAEILGLYDPDRLTVPAYQGDPASWKDALGRIREQLEMSQDGSGIAILLETVNSPTLAGLLNQFKEQYPAARIYQWESVNRDSQREAANLAFGRDAVWSFDFTKADVVVSLDSDVLHLGPAAIRYSGDLASKRQPGQDGSAMSRVYAFESQPTTIGVTSDHRYRVKPSEVPGLVFALGRALGVPGASGGTVPSTVGDAVVQAVKNDLLAAQGRSVVVAGDHHGREVHAACLAINDYLSNLGSTVLVTDPVQPMATNQGRDLADLVSAMQSNTVQTLMILGGNPAYSAPGDVDMRDLVANVPYSVYLGANYNETARLTKWQLPVSHYLEAWGDGVGYEGTYTLGQPLIEPIYDSKSAIELFDQLLGGPGDGMALVSATFEANHPGESWDEALANGHGKNLLGDSTEAESQPDGDDVVMFEGASGFSVQPGLMGALSMPAGNASGYELLVLPDPTVYDGRYSNNNWLQELPKPITNLTWDNVVLMSHATAEKLGVVPPWEKKTAVGTPFYGDSDMVRVSVNGVEIEGPAWVNYGQADDVLIVHQGYGRTAGGAFAEVRTIGPILGEMPVGGFDVNPLRTMSNPVWVGGVQIEKIDGQYPIANVQHHNTIDVSPADTDRELIKETTVAMLAGGQPFGEHSKKPAGEDSHDGESHDGESHGGDDHKDHAGPAAVHDYNYNEHGTKKDMTFYTGDDYKDAYEKNYQWAMTIDLSLCTGCNACVTACQAENNIPTVEKDQVMKGREMHWIRIDRYYKGSGDGLDKDNPPIYVQPVTCMQCEQAPCEPVCPVAATIHSSEGINQMVYNRCVGTRYCSNNCPYKVRRFNFFHYSQRADQIPVLQMLQNPDVTVRFRGVMEKCTYCNQRINNARIDAKREGRMIRDGEVKTACQVACPSGAIIFGDKRMKDNEISKSRADKRNYLMLEELNTKPRTTYLSKVTNPNPEVNA